MSIPLSEFEIHKYFTKPDYTAEQVIIGSILGDGSLRKRGINCNTMFIEGHGIKQKEYLLWKAKILNFFLNIKTLEYPSIFYDKFD